MRRGEVGEAQAHGALTGKRDDLLAPGDRCGQTQVDHLSLRPARRLRRPEEVAVVRVARDLAEVVDELAVTAPGPEGAERRDGAVGLDAHGHSAALARLLARAVRQPFLGRSDRAGERVRRAWRKELPGRDEELPEVVDRRGVTLRVGIAADARDFAECAGRR